jgi:hypothetical protein
MYRSENIIKQKNTPNGQREKCNGTIEDFGIVDSRNDRFAAIARQIQPLAQVFFIGSFQLGVVIVLFVFRAVITFCERSPVFIFKVAEQTGGCDK